MDGTTRTILANNVKRLRKQRGWSQGKLAEKAGVVQSAVSYVERPEGKSPTLDTITGIAAAFAVPVWTLLVDTADSDPAHIKAMDRIISTYSKLPESGQDQVNRVAEAEARYARTK